MSVLPRGRGVGWFASAGIVNALGTGFFYPYQLLFFQNVYDLPLVVVGAGLTATILVALPLLPATGRLVDRSGPRAVLIGATLIRAVAFAGFSTLDGLAAFLGLSVLVALGARAEQTATPVLAAAVAPDGQAPAWLALTRVVFNAGIFGGGLLAALVLLRAPTAFEVVGWANAVSFVLAAVLYLPLPAGRVPRVAAPSGVRPWRNVEFRRLAVARFLLLVVLLSVEVALPVYVVRELGWPPWTVGATLAIFTALVMGLQLPVSQRVARYRTMPVVAVGAVLHSALPLALGVSAPLGVVAQAVLMTVGALLYTLGGIISSQALMVALVAVPPAAERGVYQAFTQILVGVALAVVPLLVSVFLDRWPAGLWWALVVVVGYVAVDMITQDRRSLVGTR